MAIGLQILRQRFPGLVMGRSKAVPARVVVPGGFPWLFAHNLYRAGTGRNSVFSSDLVPINLKPATVNTIYVNNGGARTLNGNVWADGSNNNSGLSRSVPIRSIRLALARGNTLTGATRVIVAGLSEYKQSVSSARSGQADNNGTWIDALGSTTPTANLVIESEGGQVISLSDTTAPSWTSAGIGFNIYKWTYGATATTPSVIDRANIDADGLPTRLRPLMIAPANAADPSPEMVALLAKFPTQGVIWRNTASTIMYIITHDGRAPDSSIVPLGGQGAMRVPSSSSPKLFFSGINFWGHSGSSIAAISGTGVVVLVDCSFAFSAGYGGNLTGGDTYQYLIRSSMMYNDGDACDITSQVPNTHYGYLEDCVIKHAGQTHDLVDDNSWNSFTQHGTSRCTLVNLLSRDCMDRPIHCISSAYTWMLGINVDDPVAPGLIPGYTGVKAKVMCGPEAGGTFAKFWVDTPTFDGSLYPDLYVTTSSIIAHANDPVGLVTAGNGTFATYTT